MIRHRIIRTLCCLPLLLPAACGVLTLPCVFLIYNDTALFQAGAAFVFALAGNLLGALVRKIRRRGCDEA